MLLLLLACTTPRATEPTLSSPEPTRIVAEQGSAPDVASTERGDAIVGWRDPAGAPFVRRVQASFGQAAPAFPLDDAPATAGPALARYAGGAIAAWAGPDGVRVVRLDGRGEKAGRQRTLPADGPVGAIDVAAWTSGPVVLVWTTPGRVTAVRLENLVGPEDEGVTTWSAPAAADGVAAAEAADGGAWIAYNPDGLALVHIDRGGGAAEPTPVADADPTPSVTAQGPMAIAAGPRLPGLTDIAPTDLRLAAAGDALVAVWSSGGLVAQAWVDGAAVGPEVKIPLPDGVTAQRPALAAGRGDDLFVAWEQPTAAGPAIAVRRLTFRATVAAAR